MTSHAEVCPFCKGSGYKPHLNPLTQRQSELYRYLSEFTTANGFAPSFEQIAERFDYNSLATVHEHLQNLERKGYITREFNLARAIYCLVPLSELGNMAVRS